MNSVLLYEIVCAVKDKRDYELDHESRFVEPTFGSEYHYPGDVFNQIRCGSELHLAVHDKGICTNMNKDNDILYSFSYDNLIHDSEKVNEKDEFGNTALHVVAIVAYNTGAYIEMKNCILFLQSVGIKQTSVNNDGETALDLFERMIKKTEEDADDQWSKSYDSRMFNNHAYELTKLRDMFL
jgi:hypothetical protein